MRNKLSIILFIAIVFSLEGQNRREECLNCLYFRQAYKTYDILRIDTLIEFNDGVNIYRLYGLTKFRNNTTVSIYESKYGVKTE